MTIRLILILQLILTLSSGSYKSFAFSNGRATTRKQCRSRKLSSSITTPSTAVGSRIPINENFKGLHKINANPDIFVIKNFLGESACSDIITNAKSSGNMDISPVAYAGWTNDFKDLVELAIKGPVTWLAIITAWVQIKDDASATQFDLVIHGVQNFGIFLIVAIASIALFLKTRVDGLKEMRTSTSTTLDDLSNSQSGTTQFVKRAVELFGDDNESRLFESPTVMRYEAGQVLKPHFDANRSADTEDANRGGQTLATLLVYLNDVDNGGLTRFGQIKQSNNNNDNSALTIQPKLGDALLFFPADANGNFDERTEHEGCPAIDEKWIARIWRHADRVPPPFGLSDENLSFL